MRRPLDRKARFAAMADHQPPALMDWGPPVGREVLVNAEWRKGECQPGRAEFPPPSATLTPPPQAGEDE